MAIINKSITLLGATAKATSITIYLQPDGSYDVTANGTVTDGASFTEQLAAVKHYPAGTNVLDNMSAAALTELRKQNGLET
jgi:hypothetical protein